ncbi:MAG: hypothetical protein HYX51_03435 [Chloroflexi bacterium]|nr:hypothetical protein [Chloroflexota bacterium]
MMKIVIHSIEEVPQFASEAEEVEFWDTHESGPELWVGAEFHPDILAVLPPTRDPAGEPPWIPPADIEEDRVEPESPHRTSARSRD